MNTCPICRSEIQGEVCGFHSHDSRSKEWSDENRVWNDFLMRGIELPRIEQPTIQEDNLQEEENVQDTDSGGQEEW